MKLTGQELLQWILESLEEANRREIAVTSNGRMPVLAGLMEARIALVPYKKALGRLGGKAIAKVNSRIIQTDPLPTYFT
jgi:hypothetical protein